MTDRRHRLILQGRDEQSGFEKVPISRGIIRPARASYRITPGTEGITDIDPLAHCSSFATFWGNAVVSVRAVFFRSLCSTSKSSYVAWPNAILSCARRTY